MAARISPLRRQWRNLAYKILVRKSRNRLGVIGIEPTCFGFLVSAMRTASFFFAGHWP
jgi:hypothetical protein